MNVRSAAAVLGVLFAGGAARGQPDAGTGPLSRDDFNRLAVELALPIFWVADADGDGRAGDGELAVTWGLAPGAGADAAAMRDAVLERHAVGPGVAPGAPGPELARRRAVLAELGQGRPTLLQSDLRGVSAGEKAMVRAVLQAAVVIERLYARQLGVFGLEAKVPADDPASRALWFRNQGWRCQQPKTERDPDCRAIPEPPRSKVSGLYPQRLLAQEGFCEALGAQDKALLDPFVAVVEKGGTLQAVPYPQAWPEDMAQVSALLALAAKGLGDDEAAFRAYLLAASKAFLTNDWVPADEAWAKMSARNSRWYLRIAPDEVYGDPCGTKALFHVSFARINTASLKWQALLDPFKGAMEQALAERAGPPYRAREVTFRLPDFIDVVLNAGDSRSATGATAGQSLPNFGPVANEGRGRTVAMSNLNRDPDSLVRARSIAESLLCPEAMKSYSDDPDASVLGTVLHEAAHNLGPAHQYAVDGRTDREQFGGQLASTLEELKAQTAALYFADWLVARKAITRRQADQSHLRDVLWTFGHVAQGMYDDEHQPKNYSQLAAIQLGLLRRDGVLTWKPKARAANGRDAGCFAVALPKMEGSVKGMMQLVGGLKARGDKAGAQKLLQQYVDVEGELKMLHGVIAERVLRAPKIAFLYSVQL